MKNNWKVFGLYGSLFLEMLFWALYLPSLLVRIDSAFFAMILWLGGGATGIIFGIINLIGCRKKHIKILSLTALFMGVFLLALWVLTMFITGM